MEVKFVVFNRLTILESDQFDVLCYCRSIFIKFDIHIFKTKSFYYIKKNHKTAIAIMTYF